MPRNAPLPFPNFDALPDALRAELAARRNLNVFRALMHSPNAAPSFLAMTDALRNDNTLPPTLREIAILRVGQRYDAPYERHHHERIGRAAGLGDAAIAAAELGPDAPGISADESMILALTDELLDAHGLSEPARDRFLARFSANQLADFVLTAGHYQQVCLFLNTFGVEIEEPA